MLNLCPCFSGKTYESCCKPFHEGTAPENALLLMRSRYAAYALNLPEYIIATTHLKNPQYSKNKVLWKQRISQFATGTSFQNLVIRNFKEEGDGAVVTFTATLSQGGKDASFTETSSFEKVDHRWLYKEGLKVDLETP